MVKCENGRCVLEGSVVAITADATGIINTLHGFYCTKFGSKDVADNLLTLVGRLALADDDSIDAIGDELGKALDEAAERMVLHGKKNN